jgi:hypothetical protein
MGNFAGGNTIIAIAGNPHSPHPEEHPTGASRRTRVRSKSQSGFGQMLKKPARNTLFYGDTLAILREHIADESVDPIYLDPPFNFDADCNVFKKVKREKTETQSEFDL